MSRTKTLTLWVVLVGMWVGIGWILFSTNPREPQAPTVDRYTDRGETPPFWWSNPYAWLAGGALIVYAIFYAAALQKAHWQNAVLQRAESKLRDEDLAGAIDDARLVLKNAPLGQSFIALIILAECAEVRGEFGDAAEICARVVELLPALVEGSPLATQLVPLAIAKRAFALAAIDRLDEAESLLAAPPPVGAVPGTLASFVRARTIVDSKRGRYKELLDGLASAHAAVRATPLRDRLLMRLVADHARMAIGDMHRTATAPSAAVEPELARWIGLIVPHAVAKLEGRA